MPASQKRGPGSARGIAVPTIAETLETFLAETGRSRGARRQAEFEAAAGLLVECLNGYAHQGLSKEDTALWRRHYDAGGAEHREFCEVFGPEHLLPNLGEFLGWFMVRKVIGPKYLMKVGGSAHATVQRAQKAKTRPLVTPVRNTMSVSGMQTEQWPAERRRPVLLVGMVRASRSWPPSFASASGRSSDA